MLCPICKINLVIAERQGVEIDYCPECRGVWLDRGELDKIIDHYNNKEQSRSSDSDVRSSNRYDNRHNVYRKNDDDDHYRGGHRKKRESWFSDIFDF